MPYGSPCLSTTVGSPCPSSLGAHWHCAGACHWRPLTESGAGASVPWWRVGGVGRGGGAVGRAGRPTLSCDRDFAGGAGDERRARSSLVSTGIPTVQEHMRPGHPGLVLTEPAVVVGAFPDHLEVRKERQCPDRICAAVRATTFLALSSMDFLGAAEEFPSSCGGQGRRVNPLWLSGIPPRSSA